MSGGVLWSEGRCCSGRVGDWNPCCDYHAGARGNDRGGHGARAVRALLQQCEIQQGESAGDSAVS
eukprot:5285984-Prorocentrum_lima.AAC.1